jgi:excisionase family DNA binding protein
MTKLLTVKQAGEALGLKPSTMRAWVLRRKIGYVRVGSRAVRVPLAEVERLIAEGTIPAREERR